MSDNTSPSNIVMGLLLFSAAAVGLGTFYVSTASTYGVSSTDLTNFQDTFNAYSSVDAKMKAIQSAIQNTNLLNPLDWGNVVIMVINIFSILFDLPGLFHQLLTDMVAASVILPPMTVWLIEAVILVAMVFGALAAINKWKS